MPPRSVAGGVFALSEKKQKKILTFQNSCTITTSTVDTIMKVIIETSSRVPVYQQIVTQIREGIARGLIQVGERLPSVREMSRDLVVNPNTIAKAYTELERQGILNTRPGLGVFAAQPRSELLHDIRSERLKEGIDRLLTEAVHLGFNREEVIRLIEDRSRAFQWDHSSTPAKKNRRD